MEVCFKRLPNLFGKEFLLWFLQKKQDEMAFVRGWGCCSDISVRGCPL